MIVRTFTEAEGRASVTVECHPPESTVWLALHIPTIGKELRADGNTAHFRRWLAGGGRPLQSLIGAGAAQDFIARFRLILSEIEAALGARQ